MKAGVLALQGDFREHGRMLADAGATPVEVRNADDLAEVTTLRPEQYVTKAKELGAPVELVRMVAEQGKLPVVNFSAGGIATPADAALMMQLGVDGVFVGSGIFKSQDPATMARAVVEATTNFENPDVLAKLSHGLGDPMAGLEISKLETRLQDRGW